MISKKFTCDSKLHTEMVEVHNHRKYATIYIYIYIVTHLLFAQSAGAVEYTNKCLGYDTKQSDGEVPVMLELWGMRSTPLLPSLPGQLWPGVVEPDKGPTMS